MGLFKKKEPPKPKEIAHYKQGDGWGNAINWSHYSDRVHGWKSDKPRVGDLLFCPMESGRTGVWEFTAVEYCGDPPDMFFADVRALGYEDELDIPPPTRKPSMYFL